MRADTVRDLCLADRRAAAAEALAGGGGVAAEAIARELADDSSPVDRWHVVPVLRRIGAAAFDPLVRALLDASTDEAREWVGAAFMRLGEEALERYTATLSHPAPHVRRWAVRGIRHCDEPGPAALHALLPLLGDADPEVARTARDTLLDRGPDLADGLVPSLREIRREGPGRARARALSVLAGIGGEAALSAEDLAAVERLIRVKAPDERPVALWACWNHWIAVPGGDRAGIMETLGLTGPRPVTFALGNDIVDSDGHDAGDGGSEAFARVFVTPELDGWTFVLGAWCDPCGAERSEDVLRLCTRLSARYGQAQAYYYGAQGDGSAWLVAERGTVLRRYCETGEGEDELLTLGEPLPFERARRAELGLSPEWDAAQESDEDEAEWRTAAFDLAPELAKALGVSPLDIGPDTRARGAGVLAMTPYGVAHGVPTGAYRI
ncbi:HEAT repeat domain-containing protein [Streptomyces sp. NPDC059278]|uniref:HEAT repeat domain-containing protein n=1 Tax=Streptomyces sp. NPDC059278 TaxID=3346801 RepID=UPI00368B2162